MVEGAVLALNNVWDRSPFHDYGVGGVERQAASIIRAHLAKEASRAD